MLTEKRAVCWLTLSVVFALSPWIAKAANASESPASDQHVTAEEGSPAGWVSGGRIPVGGNGGLGPLSAGLNNHPVGTARVLGGERPDLFLTAGRWSSDPGLFLYRWLGDAEDGSPVFGQRVGIAHPGGAGIPPPGTVFELSDGQIYGFWLIGGGLVRSVFDPVRLRFVQRGGSVSLAALPRNPERLAVLENPDGSLEVFFSVSDGTRYRPPAPPGHRDPEYRPFDGAGIWRGGWPRYFLMSGTLAGPTGTELSNVRLVSATERESRLTMGNLTVLRLGPGRERDLLSGSRFGNLHYYRNDSVSGVSLREKRLLPDSNGVALRHPTISPTPVAYPSAISGFSDLIAGGEGGLHYYRFAGFNPEDVPIYHDPVPVMEQGAALYTGSLPVLSAVDWNGNGEVDLMAGNSEGRLLFFRNSGTTAAPALWPGENVRAAGRDIHIQQRYPGIQGPGEARWGYVCPTVADWNGNGLPDVLMSSATQRHKVFLNTGTPAEPRLEPPSPLYWRGLDLHGTWRVQPAVASLDGRMAYVMLDTDDEFRLYWKIDDFNLEDGGKLRLEDGSPIRANYLAAGGTGRLKITFADWNRDGRMDLLVGTPRHASVPNPETGLPQSKGLPGAAVLWLRNVGSNSQPVFAFPQLMRFRGEPRFFGQHACGPVMTDLGGPGGPHLLVGSEEGYVYFFHRSDVSWGDSDDNEEYGFDAWRRRHFDPLELEDPEISGPDADPGGHGFNNLMRYAFGLPPRGYPPPGSIPGIFVLDGRPFLSFQRLGGATDLAYDLEFSENLADWEADNSWIEEVDIEEHGELERVNALVRQAPRFFFRLRIVWSGPN